MTGEDSPILESATTEKYPSRRDERLNAIVDNYVMAEFVAIPQDFDLQSHLHMREQIGIYQVKNMNITQANIFIEGIKNAPVFCAMNNELINPNICFFVLQLFQELGLILKAVDNPMRRDMDKDAFMSWAKYWNSGDLQDIRGQQVRRISFLIINVVQLFQEEVYEEALTAMKRVQKYQAEINSTTFNLDERN
jgi:hypothetical protein